MLKKINKNIAIILCCFIAAFSPAVVIADNGTGKVTDVKKGEVAPFDGVLMTDDVATKLYIDVKFSRKACELEFREKLEMNNSLCLKKIQISESKLNIELDRFNKIIKAKDDRIEFLERRWTPSRWYESNEFWLSTGVVVGILITVAAGYGLSQAAR